MVPFTTFSAIFLLLILTYSTGRSNVSLFIPEGVKILSGSDTVKDVIKSPKSDYIINNKRGLRIFGLDTLYSIVNSVTLESLSAAVTNVVSEIPEVISDVDGHLFNIKLNPVAPWESVPDIIKKANYSAESHYITTSDGYILNIHRIYRKSGIIKGIPVYLQHGLLAASSDWILPGPGQGLGYILADEGYDVWMGNSRGNSYSRNHTSYDTNRKRFWDFSWHEMGIIDVPATIDYILEKTGHTDLFHIGHSQGTTTFYVMASEKPEYNKKIRAHISMAPVAFMDHMLSPLLQISAAYTTHLDLMSQLLGAYEFMPNSGFLNLLTDVSCSQFVGPVLCKNALFAITGFSPKQMNASFISLLVAHYPAGAASKQLTHYGQLVTSGKFAQFDHGLWYNMQNYNGSRTPPDYNLTAISAPLHLIYSSNDWMASMIDVEKLFDLLPSAVELCMVNLLTWSHQDYVFANDAPKFIYNKVRHVILSYL